jgi:hypothetical protein
VTSSRMIPVKDSSPTAFLRFPNTRRAGKRVLLLQACLGWKQKRANNLRYDFSQSTDPTRNSPGFLCQFCRY